MPIVFEQPDAIGTAAGQQAAIGYGTAIQGDKDRQFQLQAAALAQQARAHATQQSAVNAQLGASWTQAGNQQAAMGQQADQFAQAQMDAQSRQNAQLQQAEQMQANVFSYQDSLRLQQQQQAWSGIDADPDLSPDEKQQAKAQIAPGMNYLQFKQGKAKIAQQQQEQEQAQEQAKMQAIHTKTLGQFLTDNPSGYKDLGNGNSIYFDGSKLVHIKNEEREDSVLPGMGAGGSKTKAAGSGVPGSSFDFKESSKLATTAATGKDADGNPTWKQDVFDNTMAAHRKAALQYDKENAIEHHTSVLSQLKAIAPNGDLNQLKGPRLDAAKASLAELARLNPPPPLPKTKTPGGPEDNAANGQQPQQPAPAVQQNQQEWYPAYQKYVSEHGQKTPGEFTVYGHGLSWPQKYRVNEDGSVQMIRQPTLGEEVNARIPSGLKALGDLITGPADAGQY